MNRSAQGFATDAPHLKATAAGYTGRTIRANIENLLDMNAWYGSSLGSSVFVRDPRTFLLSATFDY